MHFYWFLDARRCFIRSTISLVIHGFLLIWVVVFRRPLQTFITGPFLLFNADSISSSLMRFLFISLLIFSLIMLFSKMVRSRLFFIFLSTYQNYYRVVVQCYVSSWVCSLTTQFSWFEKDEIYLIHHIFFINFRIELP